MFKFLIKNNFTFQFTVSGPNDLITTTEVDASTTRTTISQPTSTASTSLQTTELARTFGTTFSSTLATALQKNAVSTTHSTIYSSTSLNTDKNYDKTEDISFENETPSTNAHLDVTTESDFLAQKDDDVEATNSSLSGVTKTSINDKTTNHGDTELTSTSTTDDYKSASSSVEQLLLNTSTERNNNKDTTISSNVNLTLSPKTIKPSEEREDITANTSSTSVAIYTTLLTLTSTEDHYDEKYTTDSTSNGENNTRFITSAYNVNSSTTSQISPTTQISTKKALVTITDVNEFTTSKETDESDTNELTTHLDHKYSTTSIIDNNLNQDSTFPTTMGHFTYQTSERTRLKTTIKPQGI